MRGGDDVLYPDRVEWDGAALVQDGEAVRVVAEVAVPRMGETPKYIAETAARRAEGCIDAALAAILKEFDYQGPKAYPPPAVTESLLRRASTAVHRASVAP